MTYIVSSGTLNPTIPYWLVELLSRYCKWSVSCGRIGTALHIKKLPRMIVNYQRFLKTSKYQRGR